MTPSAQLQFRRGSAEQWALANPILAEGEPGLELETDKVKIGDGKTRWNDLPYVIGGSLTVTASKFFFSNANGVTFGTNGSTVTASVRTNYQSQAAYLTTAGLSQDSSNYARTGFTTASTVGSDVVGTLDTNGLNLGIPKYLTTAVGGAGGGAALQGSGAYSQNTGTIQFANSNGVTFGLSTDQMTASVRTDYQSIGAYLTTAALSQDSSKYGGTTAGMTGGSLTVNTAGVAISLPSYLTTAQPVGAYLTTAALSQDSSKYAGTSTGIAGGSVTLNTAGISVSLPAYLTTAMASDAGSNFQSTGAYLTTAMQSASSSVFAKTGFTTTSVAGAVVAGTHDTDGLKLAVPSYLTTAQAPGAYLTTAALSQDSSKYAGTSTGMAGGSVTLNTSGISLSLPAYLTTAALSQDSSKYAGTSTGITGGSVTLNTSGIAINLPAYLTTAALSADSSKYAGTSTGITGGSVTLNTSGIAINLPAYLTTADLSANSSNYVAAWDILGANTAGTTSSAQGTKLHFSAGNSLTLSGNSNTIILSVGAYLTTAALSGDTSKYAGINSGATNCSVTVNTSGVSVNLPAYLTTAGLSADSSKYAGTSTGITGGSVTLNTSGIAINLPAYITTADLSQNSSLYAQSWSLVGANTAGTTTQNIGSKLNLSGGQGITLSGNASTIVFSVGSYITTGALSADSSKYAGINSGATNCSVTVNTSGVSVNLPAYLTTAMLSNAATISNVFISAGTTSSSGSAFTFSNSNAVSFGLGTGASAGVITASVATVSVISLSAGTSSQTFGSIVFSNSNGISFGLNGSTVTAQDAFISYLNLVPFFFNTVTSSFAQSTSHVIPFVAPAPISIGSVRLFEVGTVAASSTQGLVNGSTLSMSGQTSHNFVFYSRGVGANSMSLQYVTSTQVVDNVLMSVQNAAGANSSQLSYTYRFSLGNTSFTKDYSSTAQSYNFHTSNVTDLTGTKQVDYPCGVSLSQGQWFLAYGRSTTFATGNAVISVATRLNISYDSQFIVSQNTQGAIGTLGGATNSSVVFGPLGLGSFSTGGAAGTTNSLNISVISSGSSNQIPLMQLVRIA